MFSCTDDHEADQGDDLTPSPEAGDDLKVLGGGGLIPESVLEDLGAHQNPGNSNISQFPEKFIWF